MIDASVDPDFAAFERQESLREVRTAADDRVKVRHGRLASLSARGEPGAVETVESAPPPPGPEPSDPLGHLQTARIGFAVAVILVIYLAWSRRRGSR